MGFRGFIQGLEASGRLHSVSRPVSRRLEAAAILHGTSERAVRLERILESRFSVVGNLFGTKQRFAQYLGIEPQEVIRRLVDAIEHPAEPVEADQAPCQEVVEDDVDLDRLPILLHGERDGGRYVTSGVFVTRSKEGTQNLDFHRAMQIGRDRFAIRVVEHRDFDRLLRREGSLPVAVCIGNAPNVLLAAATSVALGMDELRIASALEPLRVTRPVTFDARIPADCEFVLEGVVSLLERASEGPFIDLTGTYDRVREQPVFRVTCITHRKDAIWQALLPGGREHQVLMGLPREPTILREVEQAGVRCIDVHIGPGGCSWLHAVIQIHKRSEGDGRKAIEAGFRGHGSCKHIFVVDPDIDIYDPLQVEWAMATRFQADRDLVIKVGERGSSLDPSADLETNRTTKCGFDCTKPLGSRGRDFERAQYPRIDREQGGQGGTGPTQSSGH